MTDEERLVAAVAHAVEPLLEPLMDQVRDYQDLVDRLLTVVEGHLERIERLEYHVLGIQPLPKMTTARLDH